MLRAHPAVMRALGRRGITDMSLVLADMWAHGGALVPERYAGRRIGWCDVWFRGSERGNPYAHHVTGLHPIVVAATASARSPTWTRWCTTRAANRIRYRGAG